MREEKMDGACIKKEDIILPKEIGQNISPTGGAFQNVSCFSYL
jgi:hypothetical protein